MRNLICPTWFSTSVEVCLRIIIVNSQRSFSTSVEARLGIVVIAISQRQLTRPDLGVFLSSSLSVLILSTGLELLVTRFTSLLNVS